MNAVLTYTVLEKTSYALYEVICIKGILNLIQNIIKFNTNVDEI